MYLYNRTLNLVNVSCIDSEFVSALNTLIEDSLALIGAPHLPSHVVHLLRVALRAVLIHDHLLHALIRLRSLLSCLHPLFPLVEFFFCDDFVA